MGSSSATDGSRSSLTTSFLLIRQRFLRLFLVPKNHLQRVSWAFDNSPMCTRPNARAAFAWMVSCLPLTSSASCCCSRDGSFQRSLHQSHELACVEHGHLSCNFALGNPPRCLRNSSNLGSKKNSFRPRSVRGLPESLPNIFIPPLNRPYSPFSGSSRICSESSSFAVFVSLSPSPCVSVVVAVFSIPQICVLEGRVLGRR